jgi:MoxR-like ATPase
VTQTAPSAAPDRRRLTEQLVELEASIETFIRGKNDVVRLALVTLIAGGHLLIEDVRVLSISVY